MFKIFDGRDYFYQWDLDRKLIVDPSLKEVHFCNRMGNCSLIRYVYEVNGLYLVDVPNLILQESFRMYVYAYDANYTKYSTAFEIKARTKPANYAYVAEDELETWQSLDERLTALEENGIPEADLSNYATKKYVDDAVASINTGGGSGETADLSNYYNKQEVDSKIANIEVSGGSGLTSNLKAAFKTYFTNIQSLLPQLVYTDEKNMGATLITNAQAILAALDSASPDTPVEPDIPDNVSLVSISASYNGGNVAIGTNVSDLVGIVVIATYSDGTTANVSGYTLSGTIGEGNNTITVSYQGKTTTFTVVGVAGSQFDGKWVEGIYVASGKEYTGDSWTNWATTDYVSTQEYTKVVIENDTGRLAKCIVNFYNADKTYLRSGDDYIQGTDTYPSPLIIEIQEDAAYARISSQISIGEPYRYTDLKYYME